jgi:hypothetical protein
MEKSVLDFALEYEFLGFSVIPCRTDKKPLIPWLPYQTQRATPSEIKRWWDQYPSANVGIVTGPISDLYVIDIDNAEGEEAIKPYIDGFPIPPTVLTPKGGRHLYYKYPDIDLGNTARIIPGCDSRGLGGYVLAPPSKGANGNQYRWANGLDLNSLRLNNLPDPYKEYIKTNIAYRGGQKENKMNSQKSIWENGVRDENLFHIANCLVKTGNSDDYIRQTLIAIMSSWGEHDNQWIENKISSAMKRDLRRNSSLSQEVRDWVVCTDGVFSVKSCESVCNCVNKNDKATVRHELKRLRDEGIIEKANDKRDGLYRLRDTRADEIDFMNAETNPVNIRWPMGCHELVSIFPKSLVVVAGEPNAGKTAFLLNTAWKNKDSFNVNYFSSEMGDSELKIRLEKFGHTLDKWKKIKFLWKTGNFHDVIDPNGLNIIDYLEVFKDFFEAGGLLTEIHNSLNKGIAVVAIQKPKGRETGIGGERTLDKARLYLSISSGVLTIVKGKIWVDDMLNPNGMYINFKLGGGANFHTEGPWKR